MPPEEFEDRQNKMQTSISQTSRVSEFHSCNCRRRFCRCAGGFHSYRTYYAEVLETVRPRKVFEWGPGLNTELSFEAGAQEIIAIEHNPQFAPDPAGRPFVCIICSLESDHYVSLHGHDDAEIYFVDGRRRAECLTAVRRHASPSAIVCLHDAQRKRYHAALAEFEHVTFLQHGFAAASQTKVEGLFV